MIHNYSSYISSSKGKHRFTISWNTFPCFTVCTSIREIVHNHSSGFTLQKQLCLRVFFKRILLKQQTIFPPSSDMPQDTRMPWDLLRKDSESMILEISGQGSCNSRTGGLNFAALVHIATYFYAPGHMRTCPVM